MSSLRASLAVPWWPLAGRSTGLLLVGLLALVLASVFAPTSSWVVLALVTTLVVVPWLPLAAIEKNQSD